MSTYVLDGRKLEEKFTGPQWFTYIFSHVHNLNKIQVFDFVKIYINMQIRTISFQIHCIFVPFILYFLQRILLHFGSQTLVELHAK